MRERLASHWGEPVTSDFFIRSRRCRLCLQVRKHLPRECSGKPVEENFNGCSSNCCHAPNLVKAASCMFSANTVDAASCCVAALRPRPNTSFRGYRSSCPSISCLRSPTALSEQRSETHSMILSWCHVRQRDVLPESRCSLQSDCMPKKLMNHSVLRWQMITS